MRIGHGRAYLAVCSEPSLLDSELIYRACVRDTTMISDSSRGDYLAKFLDLLPNHQEVLQRLWKQYVKKRPAYFYGSEFQLRQIAYIYARRGDIEARPALYKRVVRSLQIGKVFGVEELLEVDRESALQVVLSTTDALDSKVPDDDLSAIGFAISEVWSEEWRENWARANASTSRTARVLLEELLSPRRYSPRKLHIKTLEALLSHSHDNSLDYDVISSFVEHASDSELERAARNLPKSNKLLSRFLKIFERRGWPIELDVLFKLAERKDARYRNWQVTRAAYRVLQVIESPEVRRFGLRHLGDRYNAQIAVDLFRKNYQPGDEALIRKRADRSKWPQELHSILMTLRDIVERHAEVDSEYLTYLYNTIPCGFCRWSIVKAMINRGLVNDEIRRECLEDSEEDTRKLFQASESE